MVTLINHQGAAVVIVYINLLLEPVQMVDSQDYHKSGRGKLNQQYHWQFI